MYVDLFKILQTLFIFKLNGILVLNDHCHMASLHLASNVQERARNLAASDAVHFIGCDGDDLSAKTVLLV